MTNHDKNLPETKDAAEKVVETPVVASEGKEKDSKKPKTKYEYEQTKILS